MHDLKKNNFNIIRFILAYLVFISHFLYLNNVTFYDELFNTLASISVSLFFTISGLLVTKSYFNSESILNFFEKRILRVFPAYYLMLLIILIFTLFKIDYLEIKPELYSYLIFNSLFLNFLNPVNPYLFADNYSNICNGSLWTIKIEICLYIFTPIIINLIRKNKIIKMIILIILSSLWYIILNNIDNDLYKSIAYQFPGQIRFFVVGIFLYFYAEKIKINFYKIILMTIILLVAYLKSIILYQLMLPIVLGYYVLYFGLSAKKIQFINSDISYGLYIFHFPVIQAFISINNFNLPTSYIFIITSTTILILSFLSWNFFEKKIMKKTTKNYL